MRKGRKQIQDQEAATKKRPGKDTRNNHERKAKQQEGDEAPD